MKAYCVQIIVVSPLWYRYVCEDMKFCEGLTYLRRVFLVVDGVEL